MSAQARLCGLLTVGDIDRATRAVAEVFPWEGSEYQVCMVCRHLRDHALHTVPSC